MIVLEANYSKKLDLPGYSSHQYSITLRSEIADLSQVSAKSQELHALMQSCVDREIQETGFLPGEVVPVRNGNGHSGQEIQKEFYCAAMALGRPPEKIEEVWGLITGFAGYAFRKAHSTAYGVEDYQSAWLKCNYLELLDDA